MITEDYVSFEIAKLLKEKGFDTKTHYYYDKDGNLVFSVWVDEMGKNDFIAPTLQMVMKWLREVHNLSIEPYYDFILNWLVDIKYIGRRTDIEEFEYIRDNNYNSYDEACEAGIKYCLEKLI